MDSSHGRGRADASSTPAPVDQRGPVRLVGTGRAHDRAFFVAVVRHLHESGFQVEGLWAGGRRGARRDAAAAGIAVAGGGLSHRRRALDALAAADVHLCCARSSRLPKPVQQSAELGVVTIVRDAPAFDGLAVPFAVAEVTDVALLWPSVTHPDTRQEGVRMLSAVVARAVR